MKQGMKITDYLERKKNYERHQSRLSEISGRHSVEHRQSHLTNYHALKQRTRRIKTDNCNKQIQTDNTKLLSKIMDIQSRHSQTSFRKSAYHSKPHHHAYYERVRTYDVINEQNPNIMKRIASQTGHISAQEQQKSYQKCTRMKHLVERFPYIRNINRKVRAMENLNTRKQQASQRYLSHLPHNLYQQVDHVVL